MRIYETGLGVSASASKYWTGFLKTNDESSNPHDIFTTPGTFDIGCVTFQKNGANHMFTQESCRLVDAGFICQKGKIGKHTK